MPQWLEDFKSWLNKVADDPFSCFCSVCKKSFACGVSQIQGHADSKCHIKNCEKNGMDVRKSNDFRSQCKASPLSFDEQKKSRGNSFCRISCREKYCNPQR